MANEKRLIAFDPITFESFTRHATKHREPYDHYDMGYVDAVDQIEYWLDSNTVEAVELPCRPGDHVFRLCGTKKNRYVGERIVSAVTLCGNGSWMIHSTADDALGKTVFLTREEAERAIAKMDGDGNA